MSLYQFGNCICVGPVDIVGGQPEINLFMGNTEPSFNGDIYFLMTLVYEQQEFGDLSVDK